MAAICIILWIYDLSYVTYASRDTSVDRLYMIAETFLKSAGIRYDVMLLTKKENGQIIGPTLADFSDTNTNDINISVI